MILLISAQQPELDSLIDDRFGRAHWLIQMNTETNQWEALSNPGAAQSGGAGIAAAQFAIDQKVNVVVSGNFGPHAAKALQAANIAMHLFANDTSTVQRAVEHYLQGKLPSFS